MTFTKKRRYRPLYKKFVKLNKNAQNRKKLLNFKRRKWQRLILYLNKLSNINCFKLHDQTRYVIPKFNNYFGGNFKTNLHNKQSLSLFYGGIAQKRLKFIVKKSLATPKRNRYLKNPRFLLLEMLESRLDVILYRSNFVKSIRSAGQMITHGQIKVNGSVVRIKSFVVKKGDRVDIEPEFHNLIASNINSKITNPYLWPFPPKYLDVNYRTFQIILIEDIPHSIDATSFSFKLDLYSIIKYYER